MGPSLKTSTGDGTGVAECARFYLHCEIQIMDGRVVDTRESSEKFGLVCNISSLLCGQRCPLKANPVPKAVTSPSCASQGIVPTSPMLLDEGQNSTPGPNLTSQPAPKGTSASAHPNEHTAPPPQPGPLLKMLPQQLRLAKSSPCAADTCGFPYSASSLFHPSLSAVNMYCLCYFQSCFNF